MQALNVVILAAGKGTRMCSKLPKVLHTLGGKPLVQHAVAAARQLEAKTTHVVIGHGAEAIRAALAQENLNFVLQQEQRGTGHAVLQALPQLDRNALALVLYGDVPLIRVETLREFLALCATGSLAVLTCEVQDPTGLGRILRDAQGNISAIVEHKDATDAERRITEINSGILAAPVARLHEWLPQLGANNAQGEYYLTDLVSIALAAGYAVRTLRCADAVEISGVNNRVQLAQLEREYQARRTHHLMLNGVTLRDPARVDIRGDLVCASDVEIDVNVILEGKVEIAEDVKIGPNCVLKNCRIGAATVIEANSVLENAVIGRACHLGPFARIRPGAEVEDEVRIGNFVEIKQARIGARSKVNHLSYVGDSVLGSDVNVGAGTITCNYDGANKSRTVIGDRVFIGSNTALVAPVNIASGATIGAGSVITQDVGQDQLAVARGQQRNIDGWQRPTKRST
ncbi:MAG: bifunctional UDP-N-acetylglucosamine diphosphorylase/glucosamine-1-phosphate N-acetyltransferase GlmU [Pseudomonadales bacterium]|jgi:bifunctional UDP-N-acetylglucosamine pyrophosphorylase/glucosamine-1-phosphate N-acetyltransferase|nr:bifunctional UDP-N-acetylglucosamine diphosphorylase/glucosamine-1-phosphate N-acetyltransferase GlmU [Pseudomonadales bacterium]